MVSYTQCAEYTENDHNTITCVESQSTTESNILQAGETICSVGNRKQVTLVSVVSLIQPVWAPSVLSVPYLFGKSLIQPV